jgi:TetR/AcrR family transcriptional repressor of nem operon
MARPKEFDEQEVVAKAVELFQRKGYGATSVRDLLEETGLSSSSLYATFGGKEQLFLDALQAHAVLERQTLFEQLTRPGGLRNNVRGIFDALLHMLLEPDNQSSLTLRAAVELATSMPPVFAFLSKYIQELTDMFATVLQQAADRGEVTLRFPATDLANYLLFNAYSLGVVARVGRSEEQLKRYVDIAMTVLDQPESAVSA